MANILCEKLLVVTVSLTQLLLLTNYIIFSGVAHHNNDIDFIVSDHFPKLSASTLHWILCHYIGHVFFVSL